MRRRTNIHPPLFDTDHDVTQAIAAARRCARANDFRGADRWLRHAQRHQKLAHDMLRQAQAEAELRDRVADGVAFRQWLKREDEAAAAMAPGA